MSTKLAIKVVPGASRSDIAGWMGETLKVRVSAQPERGKANAAVIAVLCGALDLPISSLAIVAGGTSARKVVEITGLSKHEVQQRLSHRGYPPTSALEI